VATAYDLLKIQFETISKWREYAQVAVLWRSHASPKALRFSADTSRTGWLKGNGYARFNISASKAGMNSRNSALDDKQYRDWLPFLEFATREVFEMMLGCHLSAPEIALASHFNVTAVVGLAGKLSGVISVRCQKQAAVLMASRMLGVELELDRIGPELSDALGEVCNMVAGNFKNKISGLGDGCMLSPPSVITGEDYTLHTRPREPTLEVNLLFESMPLRITLHLHS
jgi:chemotaxis protein CheX